MIEMNEKYKHKTFLDRVPEEDSTLHISNKYYKGLIKNYGFWLSALANQRIKPITTEQKKFVNEIKSLINSDFRDDEIYKNHYVKALFFWRGHKWMKIVCENLNYKKTTQTKKKILWKTTKKSLEAYQRKTNHIDDLKSNDYYRSLKPNIKKKKKKLNPNTTHRWTDKGFQTREGHNIMRNRYPM